MRILNDTTYTEVSNPDLEAGYLSAPTMWAPKSAYDTIDDVTKFSLDDSDYEEVQIYHAYTAEELAQREAQAAKEVYIASRHGITDEWIAEQIAKAVTVAEPPASKEGFVLVPHYEAAGNSVVWTFEPDPDYAPDADGSYLKPFAFTAPMDVTEGLFYTDGEDIWECVQAGIAEAFTAPWFEVIG